MSENLKETGEDIPLIEYHLTLTGELLYYSYHLMRSAIFWVALVLIFTFAFKFAWGPCLLLGWVFSYPLSKLIRTYFFSPECHLSLAHSFLNSNRYHFFINPTEESLVELEKAIESDNIGCKVNALLGRGMLFLEEKSYDKALRDLEEATSLDPWSAKTLFFLGEALYQIGKTKEANQKWAEALHRANSLLRWLEGFEPSAKSFRTAKSQLSQRGFTKQELQEVQKHIKNRPRRK